MNKEYKFTIYKFEGDYAICKLDTDEIVYVTKAIIPLEAKEGDTIELIVHKTL